MRIKTLELINNPKIKNLKLDFTVNNEIQDTIIFAGNNGCGKTTILDEIYLLTNHKYYTNCQRTKGKIKSIIILTDKEINNAEKKVIIPFINKNFDKFMELWNDYMNGYDVPIINDNNEQYYDET